MDTDKLIKKLGLKENLEVVILNSPTEYFASIAEKFGGSKIKTSLKGQFDFIHVFVYKKADIDRYLPKVVKSLKQNGVIWVSYPKKNSRINTDISRDHGWDVLKKLNYRPVTLISIDETWSAFRLSPAENVKTSYQDWKESSKYKKYINREKRQITLPDDFKKVLNKHVKVLEYFESLSFSHKREFVEHIIEAKKTETRARRVEQTIEKLKRKL